MMSKQISIQQQFQLVTDEDDEDEISLKVRLKFTPTSLKHVGSIANRYRRASEDVEPHVQSTSCTGTRRDIIRDWI